MVVSKGAKTFIIQVGQRQEVISVDDPKAHTGSSPVSPAKGCFSRPPSQEAGHSYKPACALVKSQTGGAPVEDCVVVYVV